MSESKTVIDTGTVIRGQIEGDEDLQVAGRVEGSITLSETLIVDPGGEVQADVTLNNAVIYGLLVGDIQATGTVQIAPGGKVVGDIRAAEVVLNEGAAFKGQIDMGEFESAPSPHLSTMRRQESIPIKEARVSVPAPNRAPHKPSHERPRTPSLPPRTRGPSIPPERRSSVGSATPAAWSATGVSKAPPVPRPSVNSPAAKPAASRPAAPAPKIRNIGGAKARKQSS